MDVCQGQTSSKGDFISFWEAGICSDLIWGMIYQKDGQIKFNPDKLKTLQEEWVPNVFNFYKSQIGWTDQNPPVVQEKIIDSCRQFPGICGPHLKNQICSLVKPETLTDPNSWKPQLCGCYSSPFGFYDQKDPQVIACSPACNNYRSVPLSDPKTGLTIGCSGTVCAIDHVSINLVQSSIGGKPTFSQICPCSPKNQCHCFLYNITVNDFSNPEEAGINFENNCSQKTVFSTNSKGEVSVETKDFFLNKGSTAPDQSSTVVLMTLIGAFLFTGILLIIVKMIRHRRGK